MGKAARIRARQGTITQGVAVSTGDSSADERVRGIGARMASMAVEAMARRLADGDYLGALEARATAVAGLDVMTRQAVAGAGAGGSSWKDMGTALQVSKQAAHERWSTSRQQLVQDELDFDDQVLDDLAAARDRRAL